ncbi:MAG: hypothetical protein ABIR47_04140 [Candidatus Kapaibacterium sp.]
MDGKGRKISLILKSELLGDAPANLRAVAFAYGEKEISFFCYFDGEISEDNREAMLSIKTVLAGFFPEENYVAHHVVPCDYPQALPSSELHREYYQSELYWAYHRKE